MPVFSRTHALSRSVPSTISLCTRLACNISFQRSKPCDPRAYLVCSFHNHARSCDEAPYWVYLSSLSVCVVNLSMCAYSLATDRLGNWMTASELCSCSRSCSCSFADFVADAIRKVLFAFKARGGGDSITTFKDQVQRPKLRWAIMWEFFRNSNAIAKVPPTNEENGCETGLARRKDDLWHSWI
jgi:hypothetical protein